MKLRLTLSLLFTVISIVIMPTAFIFFEPYGQGVFYIVFIFLFVNIVYYIYGGFAKLITYMIYFIITLISLIVLDERFEVFISLLAAFTILVHPLYALEQSLEKRMSKEFTDPIMLSTRGSYWPYFQYRADMKSFYHLPQQKKLIQKKSYLFLRQFTTLVFLFLGTFIFINETSSIINDLNRFSWRAFFDVYIMLWLFLMSYYAYRKGFTTVFRVLVLGLLPIVQYTIYQVNVETYIQVILSIGFGLFSIGIIIYEWYAYYQRVSFDSYEYIDQERGLKVYANALFEPLVYNDTYILSSTFRIKISLDTFHKHFHAIIVHANAHKILITAYAYGNEMLYLFADFHYNDRKKVDIFKTFMESKFIMAIPYTLETDKHKAKYETNFFHRLPYIQARAIHLSNLLKTLSNELLIVMSMIMYFESLDDVDAFKKHYQVLILSDIYVADYIAVKVDVPIVNNDFVISQQVTALYHTMVSNRGYFVRLLISKLDI